MKRNLNTNIFHPIIIIVSNLNVLYICIMYVSTCLNFLFSFLKLLFVDYQTINLFIGSFKTSGNIL